MRFFSINDIDADAGTGTTSDPAASAVIRRVACGRNNAVRKLVARDKNAHNKHNVGTNIGKSPWGRPTAERCRILMMTTEGRKTGPIDMNNQCCYEEVDADAPGHAEPLDGLGTSQ
jgi:hypothetical protein